MSPGGRRILIIDDNEDLRVVAHRVLTRAGYIVEGLPDAHEVDERIAAFRPDVLLCDVLMPGENGLSVCRRLRVQPETADLPIVLISAKGGGGDRRAAIEAGADRYLVKPVARKTLLDTVSEMLETELRVEVFGCRGSIPIVPGPAQIASSFGGHTTCVRMHAGRRPEVLVLDAGTGLRRLGRSLHRDGPIDAHLFLTHYHLDHIYGLPFFAPLYGAGNRVTIHGGVDHPPKNIDARAWAERTLADTIGGPFDIEYWPVSIADALSTVVYAPFYDDSRTVIEVADVKVTMCKVNHGRITYAYRFRYPAENPRSTLVYVPDNDIAPESFAQPVLSDRLRHLAEFVDGADLLIHDCMYLQQDYLRHRHWGHTGAETLARFCAMAGVPEVLLFHHNPDATDGQIREVQEEFDRMTKDLGSETRSRLAVEGEIVTVGAAGR